MIQILEPCCIDHQFNELLEKHRGTKTRQISNMIGYGDWTAGRLLEVSIPRCAGGFVGISTGTPTVDFIATVRQELCRTINGVDDRPNIYEMVWILPPLTSALRKELLHQLGKHIQSRQLTICEDATGMRAYLCYGPTYQFAICGNMYMTKCSGVLQHFTLQTKADELNDFLGLFRTQARLRPSFHTERKKVNRVQKDCTVTNTETNKEGGKENGK